MTFDWFGYWQVAYGLIDGIDNREARVRSAISRAYYFAFHRALAYLEERESFDRETQSESLHRAVVDCYIGHERHEYQKIGLNLNRLRTRRGEADYDAQLEIDSVKEAQTLMDIATDVADKVGRLT